MFATHKFSTWQCHAEGGGGSLFKSQTLLLFTSSETESHCLFSSLVGFCQRNSRWKQKCTSCHCATKKRRPNRQECLNRNLYLHQYQHQQKQICNIHPAKCQPIFPLNRRRRKNSYDVLPPFEAPLKVPFSWSNKIWTTKSFPEKIGETL